MHFGNGIMMEGGEVERSLLEQALTGRSDGFRAKVLELVVRYRWDVNDPNFLILVATGQMEVLLEQFPGQFEQRFEAAFQKLEKQKAELIGILQGADFASATRTHEVTEQVAELERVISEQSTRTVQNVKGILTLAQKEKEQMLAQMVQRVNLLSAESHQVTEKRSLALAEEMGDAFRRRHYYELLAGVGLSSMLLVLMGGGFGWMMRDRDFQVFKSDPSVWFGQQLVEWNMRGLSECQKLKRTTCNVHIESPGETRQ
jgi:hypothetical protein